MSKVGAVWEALANWGERSWEEVIDPSERLGGPSQWGSSRWGAFKKCPYYYYCLYVRKMRPIEKSEALEIGGLYHEVRARYYLDSVQAGYDLINKAEKVVPAYAATVRRLYKGWLTHSGPNTPNDNRDKVDGVEWLIVRPHGAFPYTSRVDHWVVHPDGVELVDIKTTSRRTGQLLSSYKMDSQFIGHMYLWKKVMEPAGYPPLKKYTIDLAIKTDPAQYSRETAPVDNRLIASWEYEMQEHWRELQYYTKSAKSWPKRRSYHSCHWCKLFAFCASSGRNKKGWRIW